MEATGVHWEIIFLFHICTHNMCISGLHSAGLLICEMTATGKRLWQCRVQSWNWGGHVGQHRPARCLEVMNYSIIDTTKCSFFEATTANFGNKKRATAMHCYAMPICIEVLVTPFNLWRFPPFATGQQSSDAATMPRLRKKDATSLAVGDLGKAMDGRWSCP